MWLLHAAETRLTDRARDDTESAVQTQAQRVLVGGVDVEAPGATGSPIVQQFVTPDGVLVVAYRTAASAPAATLGVPGTAPEGTVVDTVLAGVAGPATAALPIDARTAAELGVVSGGGPYLISTIAVNDDVSLAAVSSLADVRDTIDSMRTLLWWIVPVLVLVVGWSAWLVVGRALRPVHAVTRQLASIGSDSLHARVPVPAAADEVGELATTMNSMLDRLESATLVSRQLVSDASHELRTPIAVLRTELEVARRDPSTDWQSVSVGMLEEVERLQGLVDDLLLLARASERGMRHDRVDVVDVVTRVAARRREVPVDAHVPAAVAVDGDDAALHRAVDHLVANAARHAVSEVRVDVVDRRRMGVGARRRRRGRHPAGGSRTGARTLRPPRRRPGARRRRIGARSRRRRRRRRRPRRPGHDRRRSRRRRAGHDRAPLRPLSPPGASTDWPVTLRGRRPGYRRMRWLSPNSCHR